MCFSDFLSNRSELKKIGVSFLSWAGVTAVYLVAPLARRPIDGVGALLTGFMARSVFNKFRDSAVCNKDIKNGST
jgi:hypothetical protein